MVGKPAGNTRSMSQATGSALREPLLLTLSRIHRSRSMDQLREVFLSDIPRLVPADAYGLYLFDQQRKPRSVFAYRAKPGFLQEYERYRDHDPLLRELLAHKCFTHSLGLYDEPKWRQQPLYDLLARWGLAFTIEAPLRHDGEIIGTLNFAIGQRRYFPADVLALARFLCEEMDACCTRLLELDSLRRQLVAPGLAEGLPVRAREVMRLAACGLANGAIAERLGISENTVRYHLKRIYRHLGVRNRVELAHEVHRSD